MWMALHDRREPAWGCDLKPQSEKSKKQAIRLNFPTSNNEAKYEVIIAGLDLAISVS